jgi:hypothetical protein
MIRICDHPPQTSFPTGGRVDATGAELGAASAVMHVHSSIRPPFHRNHLLLPVFISDPWRKEITFLLRRKNISGEWQIRKIF